MGEGNIINDPELKLEKQGMTGHGFLTKKEVI